MMTVLHPSCYCLNKAIITLLPYLLQGFVLADPAL